MSGRYARARLRFGALAEWACADATVAGLNMAGRREDGCGGGGEFDTLFTTVHGNRVATS